MGIAKNHIREDVFEENPFPENSKDQEILIDNTNNEAKNEIEGNKNTIKTPNDNCDNNNLANIKFNNEKEGNDNEKVNDIKKEENKIKVNNKNNMNMINNNNINKNPILKCETISNFNNIKEKDKDKDKINPSLIKKVIKIFINNN
jgi:hypothetical protein